MPIPFLPSTKSAFLCFFCLRNPHFRAFRAQNRGSCAFLASEPSFSGFLSTKSRFLSSGGRLSFGEWWVLSCILTFVVCLSNFYELFLLKLPLRVCWSMLAVALLPERTCRALLPERTCRSIAALGLLPEHTCRSVVAMTWLPLSYRGAAAGMLPPLPECYLRRRNTLPPPVERRRRRNAIATTGGTPPPLPEGIWLL